MFLRFGIKGELVNPDQVQWQQIISYINGKLKTKKKEKKKEKNRKQNCCLQETTCMDNLKIQYYSFI